MLSVSERTLYRRMNEHGLSKVTFADISDFELDDCLKSLFYNFQTVEKKC